MTGLLVAALVLLPVPGAAADGTGDTAQVRTLPPVPGFAFRYHGKLFTTGPDGSVAVPVARAGESMQIDPLRTSVSLGAGREARFEKWYGLARLATPGTGPTATFSVWNPVSFRFTDLEGEPVSRTDVGEVTVKSSTGYVLTLPRTEDAMRLQATRVVPDHQGLAVKDLYYTVQTVDVEGNNIVNRSQTKVVPSAQRSITVPLLFFDATVHAKDTLLGRGVQGTLVLEYPNGHIREVRLDGSGRARLPGLPRGQYRLSVRGPGLRVVQPVTMSRAQDVDLKVVTWIDLGLAAVLTLGVAGGLLLVGHRLHKGRHAQRRSIAAGDLPGPYPASPLVPAQGAEPAVIDLQDEPPPAPRPKPVLVLVDRPPARAACALLTHTPRLQITGAPAPDGRATPP